MQIYLGQPAFSPFRANNLLRLMQKEQPMIQALQAHLVYFVMAEDLTAQESSDLGLILAAKAWQPESDSDFIWVTPRFGTISPWSSKAMDILHVSGLSNVSRIEHGIVYQLTSQSTFSKSLIAPLLHDRMVETCAFSRHELENLFVTQKPSGSKTIDVLSQGLPELVNANAQFGLALTQTEMDYLLQQYKDLARNPTLAELMMFAQINSEHCRHKIFNASWSIDGIAQDRSLFGMIRNTHEHWQDGVLSAYKDNGAVIQGYSTEHFFANPIDHQYYYQSEPVHIVIKVETHNHPTAIAPFAGAATGAGGEIRDEGATGMGAKPKAGLAGFAVSNLHIPDLLQPWEQPLGYPSHIASSLNIMLEAPVGAASFNNEFGRPNLTGYFRVFESMATQDGRSVHAWGYHKPIMIAGGLGQIRADSVEKQSLPVNAKLIVLGGPAMLIGLGGGAASSLFSGAGSEQLDFASVQRSNPEMQRRCQEVINACWSMKQNNPILSIHDVGAGGLSNALSELVHDSNHGGFFELACITTADPSMSAMEIWCNEAQERYVLGINEEQLAIFAQIADRERCPFAVVGHVTDVQLLELYDARFTESAVKLPLQILFGEASKMHCQVQRKTEPDSSKLIISFPVAELVKRVLQHPTVADKSFLITIGDRSVTGLVARDQCVGPWQVPVADVAVTASGFKSYTGDAMAVGERPVIALLNAPASARMAVAEAITNIAAADIEQLSAVKLSANWMAAVGFDQEALKLFDAVQAVAMELCPDLDICIPVGKDSLSMQMKWQKDDLDYRVTSPMSLVVTAFAPVQDIRQTLTPELKKRPHTVLLLIDLGKGKNRLGGSILAQVVQQIGDDPADLDDPKLLSQFFNFIQTLRAQNLILAYHDRSDGGLLATLCEMCFAGHLGVTINLDFAFNPISVLFSEELGAVIQYSQEHQPEIEAFLQEFGLIEYAHELGTVNDQQLITFTYQDAIYYQEARHVLQQQWSRTSYQLQALRDNPECAAQEYENLLDSENPGLNAKLTFTIPEAPVIKLAKPKLAILREQGVNGHMEMAAAFERAGFIAIDVHMTDILQGRVNLQQFQGLAACGGFSYGDVLGAGRGWANSILFNDRARDQFTDFFQRNTTFVLGVCNGCQMLSHLKSLIPGASEWPTFLRNSSEQFEARLSLVKIGVSPSIFFQDMQGSVIPIVVSHGEGRVHFDETHQMQQLLQQQQIPLQYVDNYGSVTERYPSNPNGSCVGITAVTNDDGRFTIMMPHPERVFRTAQFSWRPSDWVQENSPWMKMFLNAKNWVGNN